MDRPVKKGLRQIPHTDGHKSTKTCVAPRSPSPSRDPLHDILANHKISSFSQAVSIQVLGYGISYQQYSRFF